VNKFLQTLCYAVTFMLVFVMGNMFGDLISGEAERFREAMPGRPMSVPLEFFSKNHFAVSYLLLFPWLAFVGLPLFTARESYWDATLFLLRFSVFVPIELTLLCFFAFTYYSPNIQTPGGMSELPPPSLTWFELSMRGLFWSSVLILVIGTALRLIRNRKTRN